MTRKQFNSLCKRKKPISIVPGEFDDFVIVFENGKKIDIRGGIDGIIVSEVKKPKKNANSRLMADLQQMTTQYLDNLSKKYGKPFSDFQTTNQ